MTSDPRQPGDEVYCPDWERRVADNYVGCGSTNVEWDGVDMYDCLDCGICFTYEEAGKRPAPGARIEP